VLSAHSWRLRCGHSHAGRVLLRFCAIFIFPHAIRNVLNVNFFSNVLFLRPREVVLDYYGAAVCREAASESNSARYVTSAAESYLVCAV